VFHRKVQGTGREMLLSKKFRGGWDTKR
jgi:hypothetical protein